MASRVVSTKLSEEEYGKLVGLCSSSGFTVSKLLKRAILARMNESSPKVEQQEKPKSVPTPTAEKKTQKIQTAKEEERFLYY